VLLARLILRNTTCGVVWHKKLLFVSVSPSSLHFSHIFPSILPGILFSDIYFTVRMQSSFICAGCSVSLHTFFSSKAPLRIQSQRQSASQLVYFRPFLLFKHAGKFFFRIEHLVCCGNISNASFAKYLFILPYFCGSTRSLISLLYLLRLIRSPFCLLICVWSSCKFWDCYRFFKKFLMKIWATARSTNSVIFIPPFNIWGQNAADSIFGS
jgi:hypothetical protein